MVVNRDDPLSQGPVAEGMSVVKFGLSQPDLTDFGVIYSQGQEHLARGLEPLLPVQDLQLLGAHNVSNVLAALALVNCVTEINNAVLEVAREFSGVDHRCKPVPVDSDIVFINDSKATNVGATLAAVQGLSKQKPNAKIYLLLGGQSKGGDFAALSQGLTRQVSQAFVYGEDKQNIFEALTGKTETSVVADLEQAVRAAVDVATTGDIILLSPACASFDMFSGFEARGEAFEAVVRAIAHD
jgi:UDP-N-acetylmuramoylalanine--D-glutamate ligase